MPLSPCWAFLSVSELRRCQCGCKTRDRKASLLDALSSACLRLAPGPWTSRYACPSHWLVPSVDPLQVPQEGSHLPIRTSPCCPSFLPPGVRGPTPFLASHIFINILSFLCPPALEAAPVPLNSKMPIGVSPGINQQGATVGGRLSEALRSLANKSGSCLHRSEGRESILHLPAQADSWLGEFDFVGR